MRLTILTLSTLTTFACTPGSLKLGDDADDGTTDGAATDGAATESPGDATSEPTGGTTEILEPGPEGALEWDEVFEDRSGFAVAVGPDGSFVVIGERGYTQQGDGGIYEAKWMGKFGPDGSTVWLHEVPNPEEDYVAERTIGVGPGGEIFVGVSDYSGSTSDVVRKYGPDGVELWTSTVFGEVADVIATPEGGVIAGGSKQKTEEHYVGWAQLLDADGLSVWDVEYEDSPVEGSSVSTLAIAGDDVILAGNRGVSPGSGTSETWLRRADRATGAEAWDVTVAVTTTTDWIADVGVAGDGTILALATGGGGTRVHAFTSAGADKWTFEPEVVGPGSQRPPQSLAVASDGSFTLTDGLYLPFDDPDACLGSFSPCAVRMRVERRASDRSLLWQVETDVCREGLLTAAMPNGGVLVLAECSESDSVKTLGLLRYAP